jgi:DNA-binding protein Fis
VVKRNEIDLEFFADYKTYVLHFQNIQEAYYLSAILNSSIPNESMKEFQSRGLFGARDVSKKILDIYYPRFDGNDSMHVKLAELSKSAHEKASDFIKDNPPKQELSAIHLGRMRTSLKKHLVKELGEIDKIVKGVIGK